MASLLHKLTIALLLLLIAPSSSVRYDDVSQPQRPHSEYDERKISAIHGRKMSQDRSTIIASFKDDLQVDGVPTSTPVEATRKILQSWREGAVCSHTSNPLTDKLQGATDKEGAVFCGGNSYINSWVVTTMPIVQIAPGVNTTVIAVQGICSDGTALQPASSNIADPPGGYASNRTLYRVFNASTSPKQLSRSSGFRCSDLSIHTMPNDREAPIHSFNGVPAPMRNSSGAEFCTDVPCDYIVIGYKSWRTTLMLGSMQFVLAQGPASLNSSNCSQIPAANASPPRKPRRSRKQPMQSQDYIIQGFGIFLGVIFGFCLLPPLAVACLDLCRKRQSKAAQEHYLSGGASPPPARPTSLELAAEAAHHEDVAQTSKAV